MSDNPYQAPEADIIINDGNNSILNFDRFSAWGVFGLSIITLGIYSVYWFYSRTKTLNSFHTNKLSMNLVISMIALFVVSTVLAFFPESETIILVYSLLNLAYFVVYLVVLFSLKNRLQEVMEESTGGAYPLSGIIAFFLGPIYLQYKINECIDLVNSK